MKPCRLLVIDDHKLLWEGLQFMLDRDPDFTVVGRLGLEAQLVPAYRSLSPNIVIIDPDPCGNCRCIPFQDLIDQDPEAKVLVLTAAVDEDDIGMYLRAGARGIVLKKTGWEEIRRALHHVLKGYFYLTPHILERIVRGFVEVTEKGSCHDALDALTPREREVLDLVLNRRLNREIAKLLFISVKTVEKHRSNIMRKLELQTASELLAFCKKLQQEMAAP